MAGMRIVITAVGFCIAAFCLLEFALGSLITYTAYQRGSLRGVSPLEYARTDALFLTAAVVLVWAALKAFPKRVA